MRIGRRTKKVIQLYDKYVMPTYRKNPTVFVRGRGSYLWDIEGRKYLDFFPGWGVSAFGHCHPQVVKAVRFQAGRLLHIANNYYNEVQGLLARRIVSASFDGKCFFANSGAEANEGAMKLARKYGHEKGKFKIIAALGSFHGRTLAAMTATGQPKYQQGFEPLMPGFVHVPFNDVQALKNAFDDRTCAILLEVIQGEGGVHVASRDFLGQARRLCDESDALLILDEVQTGMGRTGKMFAYQHFGVQPDIMTLAKTLGGGVAVGAMIAKRKIGDVLGPATHATTFGGNPLACRAALTAFQVIRQERLAERTSRLGKVLKEALESLRREFEFIREVRGMGLMMAMELKVDGVELVKECLRAGLVLNCTQGNVIRFMPSMKVTEGEIHRATEMVRKVFKRVRSSLHKVGGQAELPARRRRGLRGVRKLK